MKTRSTQYYEHSRRNFMISSKDIEMDSLESAKKKERIQYLWSKVRKLASVVGRFNKLNRDIRAFGSSNTAHHSESDPQPKTIQHIPKFLFSPRSKFKAIWNVLVIILILYTATVMPFAMCFIQYTSTWQKIDISIDFFFLTDIIVNFCSTYSDITGKIVTSRSLIAKNYLKTWFLLDLFSSFPAEFLSNTASDNKLSYNRMLRIIRLSKMYKMLRILRVVKVLRLIKINFLEVFFLWANLPTNYSRMLIFLSWSIISVHLSGCFWYFIAFNNEGTSQTWIIRYDIEDLSTYDKYIASIYFVFTTLTKVGYGDIAPQNNDEKIFAIFLMGFGAGLYSYIISGLCSFVTSRDRLNSELKEKMQGIKEFAKAIRLPVALFDRMKKNIKMNLRKHKLFNVDSEQILKSIPANLREMVMQNLNQRMVQEVFFFNGRSSSFLNLVVPMLKVSVFMFKELIYEENDIAEEIYFLRKGRVHFKAENGVVFRTYVQGAYFGEVELLESRNRDSTVTAGSVECELLLLRKGDLMIMFEEFPEVREEMTYISTVRKIKHNEGKIHVLNLNTERNDSLRTDSLDSGDDSLISTNEMRGNRIQRKDTGVVVSIQNESNRKRKYRKLWSTVLEKKPKDNIYNRTKTILKRELIEDMEGSTKKSRSMQFKKKSYGIRRSSMVESLEMLKQVEVEKLEYKGSKEHYVDVCEKYDLDLVQFSSSDESERSREFVRKIDQRSNEFAIAGYNEKREKFEDRVRVIQIIDTKLAIVKSLRTQKKLSELICKLETL